MSKRFMFLACAVIAIGALIYQGMYLKHAEPTKHLLPANIEVRAALDVGSGSTGMKVVEYDLAKHKVVKLLFDDQKRVPYMRNLELSADNHFDSAIMKMGMEAIREFKQTALDLGAKKVVAIATAAFRKAANGEEFANQIRKETGIEFYIIDQSKEGILGFEGAMMKADLSATEQLNSVVWDIGGGSIQLTTEKKPGEFVVDRGQLASAPFKLYIISEIQKKDPLTVESPNPMTIEEKEAGIKKASEVAAGVDAFFVNKIHDPQTKVLAVGDLFFYGIRAINHGNPVIKPADLEREIADMLGKSDEELGGTFADVRVSNAILVLGYMKQLGIQELQILDVNNADGGLVDHEYWK